MQSMSFHPVVADLGAQLVDIGVDCLEAGRTASNTVTGLTPAGADEVSALAVRAFESEASSLLALQSSAQEELIRAGAALTQIARTYSEVDEAAASPSAFGFRPPAPQHD